MTTATWSSRLRHDSDATFREWGLEFSTKLAAVGLVQTADTGQIDWTTVTIAAANTAAGYEIWRFNDSLQGTAPIYMRVEYGTDGGTNNPRIRITVGTGSNGSGTIIGTALTTANTIANSNGQTTDTPRNSFMCCVEGLFWVSWKQGGSNDGFFFVCRTCDSAGAPTVTGAIVIWGLGAASQILTQALRFAATAIAFTQQGTQPANTALCLNPQTLSTTAVGADVQVFLGWLPTPQMAPILGLCGVVNSEFADNTTFSKALIGTTARTYMALTPNCGCAGPVSATATGGLKFACLYE